MCARAVDAEDPLFILYTSGSTGKPKGVLHTSGGYLVYAALTHELVFDLREDDIYWCTADVGWVTGHSYIVYGPLANGATTMMFEGVPNYPDSGRFWQIVDKHKVTILYTAPTAIRALMREGEAPVKHWSRKSLRLLGSVGEPINPEAWEWYHRVVGDGRCPIVDTWWQTETGGILISPLPGAIDQKPGSATLPFFGVRPAIVDGEGNVLEGACEGNLVITDSWPGQMRTVFGDQQRFIETYFRTFPGRYFTGDGARRDEDGYYWITGRVDDVLNVAGHRLGTAEIESALVAHPKVAEAAVVGCPHDIKGTAIYVYVTLNAGEVPEEHLRRELREWVRKEIGAIASPDFIQWAPSLPKTRSGKIMRRILRKIAANEHDQLGDISTLADPGVVESLVQERLNRPAAELHAAAPAKAAKKSRKKGLVREQSAGAGEARAVELVVEHAQLDRTAGLRRVNEAPLAGVDRDVRDALSSDPEKQQIARREAREVDRLRCRILLGSGARHGDTELRVHVTHQAAAIESVGPGSAPLVG